MLTKTQMANVLNQQNRPGKRSRCPNPKSLNTKTQKFVRFFVGGASNHQHIQAEFKLVLPQNRSITVTVPFSSLYGVERWDFRTNKKVLKYEITLAAGQEWRATDFGQTVAPIVEKPKSSVRQYTMRG
jgi:hypothetical protein